MAGAIGNSHYLKGSEHRAMQERGTFARWCKFETDFAVSHPLGGAFTLTVVEDETGERTDLTTEAHVLAAAYQADRPGNVA